MYNRDEIHSLLSEIQNAADVLCQALAARLQPSKSSMSVLAGMKFQRIGRHPVHGHALNAIEQINQTWTYVVALEAARVLLQMHPDPGGYKLRPGAHAPKETLDIQSIKPDLVGAEAFAAVDFRYNRKLRNDLDKMANRREQWRYVFMMIPGKTETEHRAELDRDGVAVWAIGKAKF